ncbi:MAG: glycosyltransferase family 2 protein [Planctomycetes bacterium]|nr:glycosyltransferase family 2 protein [Planctomycetota bacterium]MCB9829645.1 glycosyltransferase family 2 protein [Planctomycetota bacterium]MCB9900132.1 glycosyltransferase family 2 protein [Planctomycetota bacterium]
MSTSRTPISACIIAKDEADRIDRCLASVAWCDEIVVLDSGSRDDTVERCRRAGARVVETDWPGWVKQKQRAAEAASHDWVFSLDADERVDDELRDALLRVRDSGALAGDDAPAAYAVRRRVWFLGRWIKHGGWYPEWRSRLFDRRRAHWAGVDPHDRVEADGRVERIPVGHLEHYTFRSFDDYGAKMNRFSTVAAEAKKERGRVASWWDLVMRPGFRFFRMYVLRRGFLDGRAGYILARLASTSVFLKYAKLWDLHQQQRPGPDEDA